MFKAESVLSSSGVELWTDEYFAHSHKKRDEREVASSYVQAIGAFICHQMWLWDIFQYFSKPGNVHPFTRCLEVLGLTRKKKVINLLMPLNDVLVFTRKENYYVHMMFTTSLESIFCKLIEYEKYSRKVKN